MLQLPMQKMAWLSVSQLFGALVVFDMMRQADIDNVHRRGGIRKEYDFIVGE